MAWRLAKAHKTLRDQINALSPNRNKQSDGTIGDEAHASRNSDHNAYIIIIENQKKIGIVTGMDITHDPAHGIDSERLANALLDSRDPRIKYIISNKKIASSDKGWKWRPYAGKNPHNHHVHISVRPEQSFFDSVAPWVFDLKVSAAKAAVAVIIPKNPTLVIGNTGPHVERLQKLLKLEPDAQFGPKTKEAVIAFQKAHNLVADGKVGPNTWDELNG